jgi:elongation factor G
VAVQKGVEQVLLTGAIAGFPLQDVRVIVHDGITRWIRRRSRSCRRQEALDAIEKGGPSCSSLVTVEVVCPE